MLRLQSESSQDETGNSGHGASTDAGGTSSDLDGLSASRGSGRALGGGDNNRRDGSGGESGAVVVDGGDSGLGLDGGGGGAVARDGGGDIDDDIGGDGADLGGGGDDSGSVDGGRQNNGLDASGGGQGGGSATRAAGGLGSRGGADLEGVGVLEDVGVAVELEDETVEGLGAELGIDCPLVGLSRVVNTGWEQLATENSQIVQSILTNNVLERDLGGLGSTTDQRDRDLLAGVLGGSLPGDLEGLASRNNLAAGGGEDRVEIGGLRKGRGSKGQDGGNGELHCELGLGC